MPLAYRIAAGFSIVLAVMVALAAYHLTLFHRQIEEVYRIRTSNRTAAEAILEIRSRLISLKDLSAKVPAYEQFGNETPSEELRELVQAAEDYRKEIRKVREEISLRIKVLGGLDLSEGEHREVALLEEVWRVYVGRVEGQAIRGTADPPLPRPESPESGPLKPTENQLQRLQLASRAAVSKQVNSVNEDLRQAEFAAQLASIVGLVSALLGSVIVGRSVLRPLRRVAQGARALAEGDFTYRVKESGGEEAVALARDFNAMAARISQLDQLKKDLVSNVSHDLKAPLASMQETTRLLLEELPGPLNPQQTRLLNLNLSSGERLSRMISDLLDLSRLEAGVEDRALEMGNLGALLRETVEELENLLKEREQTFKLELPKRLVEVEGNPSALGQVLTNLLSNAFKFTPRGGALGARMTLFAAPEKEWQRRLPRSVQEALESSGSPGAMVEVWDSGPGVPEEHRERIFQRFHRVDTHRRGAQGTGLGLAIAAAVVNRHCGALWVEDGPEGGSSFKLLLWRRVPQVLPAAS